MTEEYSEQFKQRARRLAALILNNIKKIANEKGVETYKILALLSPEKVNAIDQMFFNGWINSSAEDKVLRALVDDPAIDPCEWIEQNNLMMSSDGDEMDAWIEQALSENAKAVADVKAGKTAALTSIMGAVMKISQKKADPKTVISKLKEKMGVSG